MKSTDPNVMINEALEKGNPVHPDEFIRSVYRGVLGRDPDEGALELYGKAIESLGWEGVIKEISSSKEACEKRKSEYSQEFITAVYRGVLGRDPDDGALESYGKGMESLGWEGMLREVATSKEAWERQKREHVVELNHSESSSWLTSPAGDESKDNLVRGLYRGMLRREPKPEEAEYYAKLIGSPKNLERALLMLINTDEFRKLRRRVEIREQYVNRPLRSEAEKSSQNKQHVCFIHIHKTGGTSLQNMLTEAFGEENVLHEHSDTLYYRAPSELSEYTVIAGHYNHDSMADLPLKDLKLVTFVREPKTRLLSLYSFLRAHTPSAPVFGMGNHLANQYSVEEFYQHPKVAETSGIWNHMTWCVMGDRQWKLWKNILKKSTGDDRIGLLEEFRVAIRNRLADFLFVGLHEDYNRSCEILFRLLEVDLPRIRADHSVMALAEKNQHFKAGVKPEMTEALQTIMERLIELDTIVYQEAKIHYQAILSQLGDEVGGSPC